jgi:hypothetical protein
MRPFLTMPELVDRWGGRVNDVRYELVNGRLKPSLWIDEEVVCIDFGGGVPRLKLSPDKTIPLREQLKGTYYLQLPHKSGPLACTYRFVTQKQDPSEDDQWWQLGEELTLDDVLCSPKVTAEINQVCVVESLLKSQRAKEKRQSDLTRENNILSKIAAFTALRFFKFDPEVERNTGIAAMASAMACDGFPIDHDTVLKWVRAGLEKREAKPNSV